MASSLIGETITTLMHRLDDEQNSNLSYLIKFVSSYHLSKSYQSQEDQHILMNYYGEVIEKTNDSYYKEKVCDLPKDFRFEYVDKFHDYSDMIDEFDSLSNYNQQNIINLAWFILYYKNFRLNDTERYQYSIWQSYCELIKKIKSL